MIPPCIAWLLADAGVAAIAGENVFLDVAPVGTADPYVIVSIITGVPENYIGQRPDFDNWRVQVDCYADAVDGGTACLSLAAAVRNCLEERGQCIGVGMVGKEVDTNLYRYGADWSFWISRT